MSSPVLQTVPLGFQWPTIDPFLFCVHHLDHYPAGTHEFGPSASLDGRTLGQDFDGIDGWRMYHGQVVPGFPAHPHRGFETITFVRQGLVDHSDSLGASARYGRGDVQWMTAGSGIVHAEMFPLLDRDQPNTLELFQIWMNLPAADKMVEPHFKMLWDDEIPRQIVGDVNKAVTITVIAGELDGSTPPSPPPHSWAARTDADVALWHVVFDPGAEWTIPAAAPGTARVLYIFSGDGLQIDTAQASGDDSASVEGSTGVVVDAEQELRLTASGHVELLVMQGRPIAEPVEQHGPFVMNTRAEIVQAFEDYQATRFGGWPWDRDDPVHGASDERFARHAEPSASATRQSS